MPDAQRELLCCLTNRRPCGAFRYSDERSNPGFKVIVGAPRRSGRQAIETAFSSPCPPASGPGPYSHPRIAGERRRLADNPSVVATATPTAPVSVDDSGIRIPLRGVRREYTPICLLLFFRATSTKCNCILINETCTLGNISIRCTYIIGRYDQNKHISLLTCTMPILIYSHLFCVNPSVQYCQCGAKSIPIKS